MKALLLVSLLAQSPPAAVPRPRADAQFVLGWQNLHKAAQADSYNTWLNAILYGGGGVAWYWTDHLRTQVDAGAGTREHQYRGRQLLVDGNPAYETSRVGIRESNVSVSQQYQFFRNQWFHPRVGAGVELARETSSAEYQPIVAYDNVTRTTRTLSPPHNDPPEHRWLARPFGEAGFKAYMTPRTFFTGDMRLMFRSRGLDEVLFRAGFGFDF